MNKPALQGVGLHCDYQPDVDLFYVWLGEPQRAENVEVEPGVYVRVNPSTKRAIGIEVVDCAARFQRDPKSIDAVFAKALLEAYESRAIEIFERFTSSRLPFSSQP